MPSRRGALSGLLSTILNPFSGRARTTPPPIVIARPFGAECHKAVSSWTGSAIDFYGIGTAASGNAMVMVGSMEVPFTELQVTLFNPSTGNSCKIDAISVASSATAANGAVPSGGSGQVPVTLGGQQASIGSPFVIAPGGQALNDDGSFPGAPLAQRLPTFLTFDKVPCVSVPRTDGGTGYLFFLTVRSSASFAVTQTSSSFTSNYSANWMTSSGNRDLINYWNSGAKYLTGPGASDVKQGLALDCALRATSSAAVIACMQIGDSIHQGFATLTGFNAALRAAQRLNTSSSLKIGVANFGVASAFSGAYVAYGRAAYDALRPDVVFIQAWSGNQRPYDFSTTAKALAGFMASYNRVIDLANYIKSQGGTPVLTGPIPYSLFTVAAEAAVRQFETVLKNSGFDYILQYDAIGDGTSSPQKIKSNYDSGDNVHPNEAGQAVLGQLYLNTITAIAQRNGLAV